MLRLSFTLFIISTTAFAEKADKGFMMFGDKNFAKEKTEKSKWLIKTGMEYVQYTSSLPEYNGKFANAAPGDKSDIIGLGIGVGREFYFGKGVSSTITLSGVLQNSIDRRIGQGGRGVDYELTNVRDGQNLSSYEASISLNYLFDNKMIDVQPFVDFAGGAGFAAISKEYRKKKENPSDDANTTEDYDVRTEENFLFTRFGVGVNFILFKGFISYFKVSSMMINITDRKTKGTSNLSGTTTVVDYENKESSLDETNTVTTAQLGMGYMF